MEVITLMAYLIRMLLRNYFFKSLPFNAQPQSISILIAKPYIFIFSIFYREPNCWYATTKKEICFIGSFGSLLLRFKFHLMLYYGK